MKTIHRLILVLLLFLPLGLMAQSIAGTWKMSVPADDGSMMTLQANISADGTYALDWGADGSIEVKGKYTAENGKMTVQDTEGAECTAQGVYNYKIEGNTLTMTRVSDGCPNRGGPEGVMSMTRG